MIRKTKDRKAAVYDRGMGLFSGRGRKNRRKAAAALLNEQTSAPKAPAEASAEVARRGISAEERPNPDQPGWGRTIGQEIGRARENRPSRD